MKKVLSFFLGTIMSVFSVYAADSIEHVVERGETLESIAKTYQVTVESLLEANPMAKDMFYTGMVLVIPKELRLEESVSPVVNTKSSGNIDSKDNHNNPDNKISNSENQQNPYSENGLKSIEEVGIEDFDGWYVYYSASFNAFEHGYYGLGWRMYNSNGFGGTLSIHANYGLGDGNVSFKFGPIYGYRVTDWLAVNAALRGFIQTYDKVEYDIYSGKSSSEFAITGGITLTPGFVFRLGKLQLGFGYEFGWCHGVSGLAHNAEFVIGLHL